MIAVDTSALIAITNHEPERQRFLNIIAGTDRCLISAVTLFETRIVAPVMELQEPIVWLNGS